jgi:RHS repeat-associated protein
VADWSAGKVPGSADVACIGSAKTVTINAGANHAGVVQGEGALVVAGGTLEITNALEASKIKAATIASSATLTGAGTLEVSGSFAWSGGTMSGSGKTVLRSGATGSNAGGSDELIQRTFVNEGTFTFPEDFISLQEGAEIKNIGTFDANSEGYGFMLKSGGAEPRIVNTGTFQKTAGTETTAIGVFFENKGTVNAKTGAFEFHGKEEEVSVTLASGSVLEGTVELEGPTVTGDAFHAPSGTVTLGRGTMTIAGANTATIANFVLAFVATLTGTGTLEVSGSFAWSGGTMSGSGKTVLRSGATGTSAGASDELIQRTFVNEGTFTFPEDFISLEEGAEIENIGTFDANSESYGLIIKGGGAEPRIVNLGTFQKTAGSGVTDVDPNFENLGIIREVTGEFDFQHPLFTPASTQYGGANPSLPGHPHCEQGDPVTCATGNYNDPQTDLSIGGRGVGLDLARTYNSQAGAAGAQSAFGYGWTSSFSDHLVVEKASKQAVLYQAEGSTVSFSEGEGGAFTASASTQDTLSGTAELGYVLTLANQTKYRFSGSSGRLERVIDRNGNETTLAYGTEGRLEIITDPVGRKITLAYNAEGLVESAKDPLGHTVKYTYEGGELASVTEPGETSPRWQFKYDGSHQMTETVDGRGGKATNEYNGSNQVVSQTDPAGHTLTFEYEPFITKITNTATGSVTVERFTSEDEPFAITRGFGTASETTELLTYDEAGYVTSTTDGDGHSTSYGYDVAGDRTSMIDPDKNETKWSYDATHDVETITTPKGETTTIKRDAHGNPETISRPAPGATTQTTSYKYLAHGELESVEDPLKRVWKYGYDSDGDRTSETDPEGDKRTWEFNGDSQEIATVSPRGNVVGAKASEFTTKLELDAQGRTLKITDPLGHTTKYVYDGDGNVEAVTDGNAHKTTYTYSADNEPIEVKEPSGIVTETEYDGANQVVGQVDGRKDTKKYVRNAVGEVTEVVDALGRKTTKEYDAAGNLTTVTDAAKRTTTYGYDPASRLSEVSYSDGKTPSVKYEYDADGNRMKIVDGTGTTKDTYDQLDRLTESEDGHKDKAKYEYDLANEQTKLTYPNTKSVTQGFDKDGRVEKVTDWSSNVTKFGYDPDSDQTATVFPSASKDEDKYVYNDADQMSEVKMLKSAESLASLVYTRDSDGQVKKTTAKGVPGAEVTEDTYDEDNRLTKSGVEYKYDAANNPTTIGSGSYKYDAGDELETGPSLTYAYDEVGERGKATPSVGAVTSYGFDQAGDLISVGRPEKESVPKIEDSYAYDGNGLRASQTVSGATSYLTWNMTQGLPLILSDGGNSYIYGPGGLPVEQISSGGTVTYLHHDQQGSTRLLTGSTGTVTGKCTYGAYGTPTCEGTTTTPLGYDGQYTSSDTGLIYLRAREYDPSTAQFLSVDPLEALTGEPYAYAEDNPLNRGDATGLSSWNPFSESFWTEGNFISESPLNPIPYYEKEIQSYENGCGYFASVANGLEGAAAGAALFAGGEDGADEGASIAEGTTSHIFRDAAGHLAEDTPENRTLIESVVKPGNYVRTGAGGEDLYREPLSNGTQVWAKVFKGSITNGGIDDVPLE